MIESRVWGKFQRELSDSFLLERIENHISPGFPDVGLLHLTTREAGYVELKSRDTGHWVSRHQALWLRRYKAAGGRCAIITGSTDNYFHYIRVESTYEWVEAVLKKSFPYLVMDNFGPMFKDLWRIL
jgi:hypothetical protein